MAEARPTERVAVIGGGMAGLALALAQKRSGRELIIIERDPEPPAIDPQDAFEAWARPGVPQFRHAHILLARLRTILRDEHPELHAQLREAGIELAAIEDSIPEPLLPAFTPQAGDDDLLHLWGRRATFEYVLRRYAGELPNVRFVHGARVEGLLTEVNAQVVRVKGVELVRGDQRELIHADVIVDASGKRSKSPDWLAPLGVQIDVDSRPSRFVYACRHYRLNDPSEQRSRRDGGGNLDYLGYATFYAEHGHYALSFGCPIDDKELADAMRRGDGFSALCQQFPVLRSWTENSASTTKVLGAGAFENRWTRYGLSGGKALHGFFPLGDTLLETNPMYGRGCSAAFVQARVLSQLLDETADPALRARQYQPRVHALLNPYFEISAGTDRMYHARARLRRGLPVPLFERVLNHLYENAWLTAINESMFVTREFIRQQQMREISGLPARLVMMLHLLLALLRSWLRPGRPRFAPKIPAREGFLQGLRATLAAPSSEPDRVTGQRTSSGPTARGRDQG